MSNLAWEGFEIMVSNSFTVVTAKHMNIGKNPDRILATSSHFPQCKRCLGEQGVVSRTSSVSRKLF